MNFRHLAEELATLARLFERASCDWPNLGSRCYVDPIGEYTPWCELGQLDFFYGELNESQHYSLVIWRTIGKYSNNGEERPESVRKDLEAVERLSSLSDAAIRLCERLPIPPSFCDEKELVQWVLFVHERSTAKRYFAPGNDGLSYHQCIDDLFLESSIVLKRLEIELQGGDKSENDFDSLLAELTTQRRRMMEFLLNHKTGKPRRREFVEHVWFGHRIDEESVKKAVKRLNDNLLELESSLSVSLDSDFVTLNR